MRNDPILKNKFYHKNGTMYRMEVTGGLHMISGNGAPYFSLTAQIDRRSKNGRWVDDSGGCCHDLILRFYPELADLAALHLSDINGVPMHAVENGWYWYKGGCFVFDEWKPAEVREKTTLQVLAEHLRISEEEAEALRSKGMKKAEFAAYVEAQKPRWKTEAEACIKRHGLIIYGDHYEGLTA